MFQPALVIDPPLLNRGIPLVSEPLALRFHRRLAGDGRLLLPDAVALEFQPPRPAAVLRRGEESTRIELRSPLLTRISRLPHTGLALDGHESMLPRRVRRADVRPVGFLQALGHLVGRSELLGLARLGVREGRGSRHFAGADGRREEAGCDEADGEQ